MKRTGLILKVLLAIAILYACQRQEKFEMINGIKSHYFVRNPNAEKVNPGDVIEVSLRYTTEDDSVLFDSKGIPFFKLSVHHSTAEIPTIDDALAGMHIGDSALFLVSAESFYVNTKRGNLPQGFHRDDMLKFYVKIKQKLTQKEYLNNLEKKNHSSAKMEDSLLKRYLLNANITEKPSPSGLYYIEKKKGTGAKPEVGDKVTVNYTGTFIDGKPFDSSLERGEPFTFTFGIGQVIPGWEEGIAKMREGGKAQLIIPSNLAYGSEGKGPIPPFSTLIFDIELLKVQKANK